jgi:hypothetical protein
VLGVVLVALGVVGVTHAVGIGTGLVRLPPRGD